MAARSSFRRSGVGSASPSRLHSAGPRVLRRVRRGRRRWRGRRWCGVGVGLGVRLRRWPGPWASVSAWLRGVRRRRSAAGLWRWLDGGLGVGGGVGLGVGVGVRPCSSAIAFLSFIGREAAAAACRCIDGRLAAASRLRLLGMAADPASIDCGQIACPDHRPECYRRSSPCSRAAAYRMVKQAGKMTRTRAKNTDVRDRRDRMIATT